jgi:hypothetical protein
VPYRVRMRIGACFGAVLLVVALAGCSPDVPRMSPPPTPSVAPLFASDDEALAAAEEAYTAYLAMSDEISHDGGANPERIAPFVTEERLAIELRTFNLQLEKGIRGSGSTASKSLGLQRFDDTEVIFYTCWDATGVRVLDANGVDVTPIDRDERLVLEVVMEAADGELLLESDEPWSGELSC